jgi:predicted permease
VTLMSVDPGFRPEQLLTLQIQLPGTVTTPDARRGFYRELFARLEAVPGVVRVGGTTRVPLGSTNVTSRVTIEGGKTAAADTVEVEFRRAMHAYFATMGMPIVRGRDFLESDGPGSPPVVIVNQAMARKVWGAEDPIGKHVRTGNAQSPWSTVVGVVGDVHHANLDESPSPEMYVSYLSAPPVAPYVVLRTIGDPATLSEAVRASLKSMDKDLVVYDLRTGDDLRTAALSPRRFIAVLATLFGLVALTLAAVGVYGVMALMVTERTREMGIRMALGAAPLQVLGLVARQGLGLAAIGTAFGLVASVALTPLMSTQLFGVRALDPVTLATVPMILLVTALVACAVPARRAMRVDPIATLRDE